MSNIEWTEATWNPLAGCTRASPGCDLCYAARMSLRLEAMAKADIAAGRNPGGKRKYIGVAAKNGRGVPAFNGTINLDYNAIEQPLKWKRSRMIFVNSMSDLFHKDVPPEFVHDVFDVMAQADQHIYQVLTKRPDNIPAMAARWMDSWPPHVWIGTSVEDQPRADERIPHLLRIPAAVRFLSCEPLLGPVDISLDLAYNCLYKAERHCKLLHQMASRDGKMGWHGNTNGENYWAECEICGEIFQDGSDIQWVIVGGESGPQARPMNPDWARQIRDDCQAAGVAFFFKQWGEWLPMNEAKAWALTAERGYKKYKVTGGRFDGQSFRAHHLFQDESMMRVGKKEAGRLLDGREWSEFPDAMKEPA